MKYMYRTISWRFQETTEPLPELKTNRVAVIQSPMDLFENYHSLFVGHVRERFIVFWLSASNKVLGFEIVTEGILNSTLTHPREVFRGANIATAASIIVAHNHPSGNTVAELSVAE